MFSLKKALPDHKNDEYFLTPPRKYFKYRIFRGLQEKIKG
ncbi:hypothetical protein [Polaromonas sp. CG9_12]|nr:hypothetical protein [Polaromonas sp. CG9_12]